MELAGEGWLGNGRCSATSSSPTVMLQLPLSASGPALADCRVWEGRAALGRPPIWLPAAGKTRDPLARRHPDQLHATVLCKP